MWGSRTRKGVLLAVVVVTMAAVVCACPFGLMANAQMTTTMGHDMGTQKTEGMCPMLCGVPPYSVGVEPNGFVLGFLPVHPVLNPTPPVRPIFHPPTLV